MATTYIDHSGRALVELVSRLAPLAEMAAEIIVEEIQAEIDAGSPSGRRYYLRRSMEEIEAERKERRRARESGRGEPKGRVRLTRTYQASAPGEPPAKPTLRYRNSWHATSAGRRGNVLTALAFSKAKAADGSSLAAALEWGTTRMRPRPHIRPALVRAKARIAQLTRGASAA